MMNYSIYNNFSHYFTDAVPSVFPRKNTPIKIHDVLPSKMAKTEKTAGHTNGTCQETLTNPTEQTSIIICPIQSNDIGGIDELETGTRSLVIESATISDDQLILTVLDPSTVTQAQIGNNNSTETSATENDESSDNLQKHRKRRKWNRTSYPRNQRSKRKSSGISVDDVNIDGVEEALAGITMSSFSSSDHLQQGGDETTTTIEIPRGSMSDLEKCMHSLQTVTLPLDDLSIRSVDDQNPNYIEQELLQSIQAVSLHCGDGETESQSVKGTHDTLTLANMSLVPSFMSSSSGESIFSDARLSESLLNSAAELSLQPIGDTELDSAGDFMAGINADLQIPSASEIDKLANHFSTSLLPITFDLNLKDFNEPTPDSESVPTEVETLKRVSEAVQVDNFDETSGDGSEESDGT